ncbi:MAG: hypothetical protein WAN22_34845 [Solirubrobacteraceae bacterium]
MTPVEQLLEMLPTVDPDLGALVRAELQKYRVDVSCGTRVDAIQTGTSIRAPPRGQRRRTRRRAAALPG